MMQTRLLGPGTMTRMIPHGTVPIFPCLVLEQMYDLGLVLAVDLTHERQRRRSLFGTYVDGIGMSVE